MSEQASPSVSPARGYVVLLAAVSINLILGALYAWSVIGRDLVGSGWPKSLAPLPFAVATAAFAITMIFAGRVQDKIGPRMITMVGGLLLGGAMVLSSQFTTSPVMLSLIFGILGGVGIGLGYAATTPATMKWFHPARKGLVTGLVVAGIGLASTYMAPLTTQLIGYYRGPVAPAAAKAAAPTKAAAQAVVEAAGGGATAPATSTAVVAATTKAPAPAAVTIRENMPVSMTLVTLGIGTAILVPLMGLLLVNPPAGYVPPAPRVTGSAPAKAAVQRPNRDWNEVLTTGQFWFLWITFILAACPGLMLLGNAASISDAQAPEWKKTLIPVVGNLGTLLVVTLAFANTLGRIISGYVSDRIGRTNTMVLFFVLQSINMFCFSQYGSAGWLIFGVIATGMCYGPIFTLMPAAMADFFGIKNLGVNYGLLFTAFGVAGSVGSLLGSRVAELFGGYFWAYIIVACMLIMAAALALVTRAPKVPETITVATGRPEASPAAAAK